MKVRMKVEMSGTLNGEPYPAMGSLVDLPDVVAEKFLASGLAVKPTTRVEVNKEEADEPDEPDEPEAVEEKRPAPAAAVETATPRRGRSSTSK